MGPDREPIKEIKSMADFTDLEPGQSVMLPEMFEAGIYLGKKWEVSCNCCGVLRYVPTVLRFREDMITVDVIYALQLPETRDFTVTAITHIIDNTDERYPEYKKLLEERQIKK